MTHLKWTERRGAEPRRWAGLHLTWVDPSVVGRPLSLEQESWLVSFSDIQPQEEMGVGEQLYSSIFPLGTTASSCCEHGDKICSFIYLFMARHWTQGLLLLKLVCLFACLIFNKEGNLNPDKFPLCPRNLASANSTRTTGPPLPCCPPPPHPPKLSQAFHSQWASLDIEDREINTFEGWITNSKHISTLKCIHLKMHPPPESHSSEGDCC